MAVAAEGAKGSASSVQSAAQGLSQMAANLQRLVGQFKYEDETQSSDMETDAAAADGADAADRSDLADLADFADEGAAGQPDSLEVKPPNNPPTHNSGDEDTVQL